MNSFMLSLSIFLFLFIFTFFLIPSHIDDFSLGMNFKLMISAIITVLIYSFAFIGIQDEKNKGIKEVNQLKSIVLTEVDASQEDIEIEEINEYLFEIVVKGEKFYLEVAKNDDGYHKIALFVATKEREDGRKNNG